ncbi:hypothetical protein E8E11_004147 [Didymella keratinophila]|nr:hypothetical protein E8E11_004147 [Didymella keratinophila]
MKSLRLSTLGGRFLRRIRGRLRKRPPRDIETVFPRNHHMRKDSTAQEDAPTVQKESPSGHCQDASAGSEVSVDQRPSPARHAFSEGSTLDIDKSSNPIVATRSQKRVCTAATGVFKLPDELLLAIALTSAHSLSPTAASENSPVKRSCVVGSFYRMLSEPMSIS